jgi:hypothetical protein
MAVNLVYSRQFAAMQWFSDQIDVFHTTPATLQQVKRCQEKTSNNRDLAQKIMGALTRHTAANASSIFNCVRCC